MTESPRGDANKEPASDSTLIAAPRRRPPSKSTRRRSKSKRSPMTVVTHVGTIVGLLTGIAALVFLVAPDLQRERSEPAPPPSREAAVLERVEFDPDMSRSQYLSMINVPALGFTPSQLAVRGAFVSFRVTLRGFQGIRLTLRREVFNLRTETQASEDNSLNITPPTPRLARVWQVWAPRPSRRGPFVILIKLFSADEPAPLEILRTPEF